MRITLRSLDILLDDFLQLRVNKKLLPGAVLGQGERVVDLQIWFLIVTTANGSNVLPPQLAELAALSVHYKWPCCELE